MTNPRTPTDDDDGWVTFSRAVIDGRLVLVQKRDGSTRTVIAGLPECPWVATNSHIYPSPD